MKNLRKPCCDPWSLFLEISRSSTHKLRQSILTALTASIQTRYQEFDKLDGDFTSIEKQAIDAQESNALKTCYSTESDPLKRFKQELKSLQAGFEFCQYCGLNEPDTIDHYLPKNEFPEFSTHPQNLVPCCGRCNQIRGRKPWRDQDECSTLHLYFDVVDDTQRHLSACYDGANKSVDFSVSANDTNFGFRYKRHFETLNLEQRLGARASGALDSICSQLQTISNMTTSAEEPRIALERFSINYAEHLKKLRGINHWEVALWLDIAGASHFIESCLERGVSMENRHEH